jgi:hypothetical protein
MIQSMRMSDCDCVWRYVCDIVLVGRRVVVRIRRQEARSRRPDAKHWLLMLVKAGDAGGTASHGSMGLAAHKGQDDYIFGCCLRLRNVDWFALST